MAYSNEVLADSPLVYYRLEYGALTTDSSGNGRSTAQAGTFGTAQSLVTSTPTATCINVDNDPAANRLELVDSTPIKFTGTATFSAELWFRPVLADATFRRLISWSDDATAGSNTYGILFRDGVGTGIGCWRRAAGTDVISYYLPPSWSANFHVVMTYDGVNVTNWVNAVQRDQDASGAQGAYGGAFRIGVGQAGGSGAKALIDEVAVYSGVLSQARIEAHYAAGIAGGDTTNLLGIQGRGAGW